MNATVDKANANANGNGNGCTDIRDCGENGVGGNETNKGTAISSDVSLPNDVLERLFQRYSIKQRRAGLESFLATSVLFDLWVICVPQQGKSYENIGTYQFNWFSSSLFSFHSIPENNAPNLPRKRIFYFAHYVHSIRFGHLGTIHQK